MSTNCLLLWLHERCVIRPGGRRHIHLPVLSARASGWSVQAACLFSFRQSLKASAATYIA